jgi:hypothetical protein
MWKAEKYLQIYRGLLPHVEFRTISSEDGGRVYSEMRVSVLDTHLFPNLSKILLKYEEQPIIEPLVKFIRLCYLDIHKLHVIHGFTEYDNIDKIPGTPMWHMSSFYCAYTRYPDIPEDERTLFKGSGQRMFTNTISDIESLPIIIEAEAGIHTFKQNHRLYKLYEGMGFKLIGPYTTDYAAKLLEERIQDNEDVSSLGQDETERIENLKWSTCLMIRDA